MQKGAVVTTSFGVRKWNPRQAWHWWRKHPEAILLPGPLQEGLPLVQLCVPVWFFPFFTCSCISLCCTESCVEGSLCWGGGGSFSSVLPMG